MQLHPVRASLTLMDCIEKIQTRAGIFKPSEDSDSDWCTLPRTEIVIRRPYLLEDALKEGHKRRFDPRKYLRVCIYRSLS